MRLRAEALTDAGFAPFGEVVSCERADVAESSANQGTALRRDGLTELRSSRPHARLNVASFRCAPRPAGALALTLLERHAASSQLFVPMNARRYLVVVAHGGDAPDLGSARAFVASGAQGVSYAPGVWHHPMIALDEAIDFACFVYEDGTALDCETRALGEVVEVDPG